VGVDARNFHQAISKPQYWDLPKVCKKKSSRYTECGETRQADVANHKIAIFKCFEIPACDNHPESIYINISAWID
jgi:hypothetical protein